MKIFALEKLEISYTMVTTLGNLTIPEKLRYKSQLSILKKKTKKGLLRKPRGAIRKKEKKSERKKRNRKERKEIGKKEFKSRKKKRNQKERK